MSFLSRRAFLGRSTAAVAATGVAAAVPSVAVLGTGAAMPASVPSLPADLDRSEPVIVHVADASTGELCVFTGERQVVLNDPELVSRIFNASR